VKDVVTNVSKHVWRTPVLRERQSLALSTLLENKACDGTLLFVDRTGGGKSHVMRVAGTCVQGIIVVTAPTLALAETRGHWVTKFHLPPIFGPFCIP
jgi:superfamily II DNA helicase RecQ